MDNHSGTSLRRTPLGSTKLSIIERVSSGQGFVIGDSVSVHYREGVLWRGVSVKRGSTLDKLLLLENVLVE